MSEYCRLSLLLCFCVSVFKTSMNSTESQEHKSFISAITYRRSEDIPNNTATYGGKQVRDRVIQFIDLTKYKTELSYNKDSRRHNRFDNRTVHEGHQVNSQSQLVDNELQLTRETQPLLGTLDGFMTLLSAREHSSSLSANLFSTVPKQLSSRARGSPSNSKSGYRSDQSDSVESFFHTDQEVKRDLNASEDRLKRLPKAIIIGVKKAGTRALLEFLRIHPFVKATGPEPHFFDRNYEKGIDWYRDLMPVSQSHQITIEKTPGYFVTRRTPKRIFEMNPSIKLILVVRDPVTRAISDYCQAVSKRSMKSFEEMALLNDRLGLVNISWGAIRIGVYAKHIEHWLHVFSLNQIHLVDATKLILEPASEVNKVETFLGLPKYINASHFLLRGFKDSFPCLVREGKPHCLDVKTKGRDHPVIKDSVLQRLRDFYRPFNAKFYQMVGRYFQWS